MKKILLDTNAYVAFMKGSPEVLDAIAEADLVLMSVVVLGELFTGFYGGSKFQRNKEQLDIFLEKSKVKLLNVTYETSEVFGEIKNKLKKAGTPIPINDVWIAAQAIETGSKLATLDDHFDRISGIRETRLKSSPGR
jgi:tRNA(fMet)-specific endonuclease VapC